MMADEIRELVNPKTGQRLVFVETARDTGGRRLVMDAYFRPEGQAPPEHFHPLQEEHFEVRAGRMAVRRAGAREEFAVGESFDVSRGTPHAMHAAGDEEAVVRWTVTPALRTQEMFETLWGLAADGKTNAKGVPNLLQAAVIARAYANELRVTSPPRVVQNLVLPPLERFARWRGYRDAYPAYRRLDPLESSAM
jgi:quercetin dioxygenase-like cupin family protein